VENCPARQLVAVVTTVAGWTGLFAVGGPVEATGRLTYIDGCTDTVLAAPLVAATRA